MVFEVLTSSATAVSERMPADPELADARVADAGADPLDVVESPAPAPVVPAAAAAAPVLPAARRPLPTGVLQQLLRSAVALQAEGVLRTAGALAGAWGGVLDRTAWIERDARDLSLLAAAAVAANAPLPAGVDSGAGDPDHPGSVVESLLAGHEALVRVLRQLADAPGDDEVHAWRAAVRGILSRREEEILLLRAVGACGRVPADERYMRGRPPRP